jgi:hypothetical protein
LLPFYDLAYSCPILSTGWASSRAERQGEEGVRRQPLGQLGAEGRIQDGPRHRPRLRRRRGQAVVQAGINVVKLFTAVSYNFS